MKRIPKVLKLQPRLPGAGEHRSSAGGPGQGDVTGRTTNPANSQGEEWLRCNTVLQEDWAEPYYLSEEFAWTGLLHLHRAIWALSLAFKIMSAWAMK